jgi:ABC-type glycerol-3-phosphate transport system substrate-binding protein
MSMSRVLTLLATLAIAVVVGACTAAPAPTATSTAPVDLDAQAQAAADVLDEALVAYETGDAERAMDLVADAYENHFELIEHPLEEIDETFMHDLETLIATRIRAAMDEGQPVEAVRALVAEAKAGLVTAQEMLEP